MLVSARVAIACAFDENAIVALSLRWDGNGRLVTRYVPRRLDRTFQQVLRRLPATPAGLAAYERRLATRQRQRHLSPDVPTSVLADPVRMVGSRYRTPATHTVGNYLWKALFDRATAPLLVPGADVLLGQPGSSLHTFRRFAGPLRVFHATDAHPRERNDALIRQYGARVARAETYPRRLVERIDQELAVADRVLVPSGLVRQQMEQHGVPPEKILTVPYGVDTSQFAYDPDAGRGSGRPSGRPRIIYVGQVSLIKGIPILLEAVRGLSLDLSIIGNVFDRRLVRRLPDNVELVGGLTPAALAEHYANATAFVLPTLSDAYGLVVLEALAAGLPVITTTAAGAAELLDARHVVVEAGDVAALRSALQSITAPTVDERMQIANSTGSVALPDGRRMGCDWDSYAAEVAARIEQALVETGVEA